jgi:hypothetical protein
MRIFFVKLIVFTALFVMLTLGYAAVDENSINYIAEPELFSSNIGFITILPVVDVRSTKNAEVDIGFDPDLGNAIRAKMSGELITIKGYKVKNSDTYGGHDSVTSSDLENPSAEWIKQLGPKGSTYNLVLVFSDIESEAYVMTDRGSKAEISAYLFDKNKGKLIWRDANKSTNQAFGFGLLYGLMGALQSNYGGVLIALGKTVEGLMQSFPVKGMSLVQFNKIQKDRADRINAEKAFEASLDE